MASCSCSTTRHSPMTKPILGLLLTICASTAQTDSLHFLNRGRPTLDAHNCYPYEGRWADRLDRALRSGKPVVIEQDLTWHIDDATGRGRIAISHSAQTRGD